MLMVKETWTDKQCGLAVQTKGSFLCQVSSINLGAARCLCRYWFPSRPYITSLITAGANMEKAQGGNGAGGFLSLGHRMLIINASWRSQMGWGNWWKVPWSRRGSTYLIGRRGGMFVAVCFFYFNCFSRPADSLGRCCGEAQPRVLAGRCVCCVLGCTYIQTRVTGLLPSLVIYPLQFLSCTCQHSMTLKISACSTCLLQGQAVCGSVAVPRCTNSPPNALSSLWNFSQSVFFSAI